jgi:hypothetical protein
MQEEMKALHQNMTWDLVKLPNGEGGWMQVGVHDQT